MSLFLGKIHYWLFNKITWFEEIEKEIENVIEKEGLPAESWRKEIYDRYGKPSEKKPLENIIDTSNIHGWLQSKIISAEGRQAAWVTRGVSVLGESFLDSIREVYRKRGKRDAAEYAEQGNVTSSPAEVFTAVNNFILDGMPCDRVNHIIENNEEHIVWESTSDIHGEYWEAENGRADWFYDSRDEWIRAFAENISTGFTFNKISENTREIKKQ